MRFLSTVAFRAIKTKSTMGFDIPVDLNIHSYQNPVNSGSCYSCRLLVSELSKSCQQSKLTFLSIVAFKGSKILSIVKVDISVDNSYQHWQLICLLTVTFRITQILLTVRVDTTVDPYLSDLAKTWKTLCFQSTASAENRSLRSHLRKVKMLCFLLTVWLENRSFLNYFTKKAS